MTGDGPGSAAVQHPEKPGTGGRLFVISAPSGAGKTTLCHVLLDHFKSMVYSVSATTRPPRKGEKEGVDYFFVTKEAFERGIQDHRWAEWAKVHGHYYGTSVDFIDARLAEGKNILLDIDVQGTMQILKRYPDSITIFIMPPSVEALRHRMYRRGMDAPEVIDKRMANAKAEMAYKDVYRHVLVNDCLKTAKDELIRLVENYIRHD